MQPIFSLEANLENICYPDDFQGIASNEYTSLISILIERDSTLEQIEEDFITAAFSGDCSCPRAIPDEQVKRAIAIELRDLNLNWYFGDEEDDEGYYQAYMTLKWDYNSCIELVVPQFLLSAIVNGDRTGISEEDEKSLDQFLTWADAEIKRSYPKCSHPSWVFEEDSSFVPSHNVTGIGGCECVSAKLVAHF